MHIWWGRTPVSSTEVILKAAMLDDESSRVVPVQERLQEDLPDKSVTVFDPFAGFGGIPLAAQRLGIKSISVDLNPVAVMLNKAATEIPAQFAGVGPVHMQTDNSLGIGAQGLASDVEYYGQWMLQGKGAPPHAVSPTGRTGRASLALDEDGQMPESSLRL